MTRFVDRRREIQELNSLLGRGKGQLVLVYGRRRVGKTTLLLHWAESSGLPVVYWTARRQTADATRLSLVRALRQWAGRETADESLPRYASWEPLFEDMLHMIGDQPLILIFDEFGYATQGDASLPSHLQVIWDHHLKGRSNFVLVLAGSHIGTMQKLQAGDAPLYGRFTARLRVDPLPFGALAEFFPRYNPEQRVALFSILGGIPAYWEQFDPNRTVSENVHQHLFQSVGMFRDEPMVLLGDLLRETRNYETVLQAIAQGGRTLTEIAAATGIFTTNLSPYLKRLREMRLVEHRVSALVPPKQRRTARGRYHLRDPYLRFYFRYIDRNLEMIERGLTDALWAIIEKDVRSFIGATTFEDLSREWVVVQARTGTLPFLPEVVGGHWAEDCQIDVVAASWREKAVLLGECKWGDDTVGRTVVRELVSKAPLIVPEKDWQIHYVLFARAGFTDAARSEAEAVGAQLVDLEMLDADLRRGVEEKV